MKSERKKELAIVEREICFLKIGVKEKERKKITIDKKITQSKKGI